jgi:hypothetical protein
MPGSPRTVYLISCVGRKLSTPAQARDLYTSEWFVKARDYVENTGCPWFILSAEHGLVTPERILAPYERTLNTMRKPERQAWATRVKAQMEASLPATDRIIVLAGMRYREFLMEYLERRAKVEVPMERRGIGQQLQYLTTALRDARM